MCVFYATRVNFDHLLTVPYLVISMGGFIVICVCVMIDGRVNFDPLLTVPYLVISPGGYIVCACVMINMCVLMTLFCRGFIPANKSVSSGYQDNCGKFILFFNFKSLNAYC